MREVEAFLEGEFEAVNERLRATGGDAIVPGGVGTRVGMEEGGIREVGAAWGAVGSQPRARLRAVGVDVRKRARQFVGRTRQQPTKENSPRG